VGARLLTALLLVLTAGCGRGADAPATGPAAVRVTISRDYGTRVLTDRTTPAGESALNGLRRVSRVSTTYAGRFVQAINGLAGDRSGGYDWLYFVNGIAPDSGAADLELHPGDREWWDRRYWSDLVQTPVVIGAWPEPFVHGYGGHRHPVSVTGPACAAALASALSADGADVVSGSATYQVKVETFAQAAGELSDWQGRGLTVSLQHGKVMLYRGAAGRAPLPAAHAVIVGYQPPVAPGAAVVLVVAGDSRQSACAAANTLASHPAAVADTYAVALDANGTVIAAGGRS
jgi:hypothetical protein